MRWLPFKFFEGSKILSDLLGWTQIKCLFLNSIILMDELGSMLGFSSPGSSLPWLWIIEYLSSFSKIDTSIIRGLIEAAPVLPHGLGTNTTEMVSLRCLEELFGPENDFKDVDVPDSRVVFDLSESCKDVLKQILQEVSVSDLKKAGPKLLRWDVHPFIMHKRASQRTCALEQLKDSMFKDIPVIDGDEDAPKDENGDGEGNLVPHGHGNRNDVLQDGLLEGNLIPSKRYITDVDADNLVGLDSGNPNGMFNHNDLQLKEKKFKQDGSCSNQSVGQIPIPLHGNEQVQKDSQANEVDRDGRVTSRTVGQSDGVFHVKFQDNQIGNAQNAGMVGEEMYGDTASRNISMIEPNHFESGSLQKVPSGDSNDNVDQVFPLSSPKPASADVFQQKIDSDEANVDFEHPCTEQLYEDERLDVALKKSLSLSSRCTSSQDPLGTADWIEQNLCFKCIKSGRVLVCSSNDCPIVVHESCFGTPARFDDKGNFRCPYCAYSVSISQYLEAKGKVTLAREELCAFMELFAKILPEEQRKPHGHPRLNGDEGLVGEVNHGFESRTSDKPSGPSTSHVNSDGLCVEEAFMGGKSIHSEENEGEEKVDMDTDI
ncbi:PREDICTED: uncharacterized protein LOC18591106 isoform X2 [Theobroma cacao]|uniref:Uncharacterized protein LOC18591106 isoform X2 n=1 Tax=Theobroma cacao TaxID=3641 RepID=A0AB32WW02_THECC|nr:PREDICTED: uncharacterized protein LOC18591106 isoform X2 [Theobroma cacao]